MKVKMKVRDSGMPEEELWKSFFSPGEILTKLDCININNIAEFGCGYGTFTIEAARRAKGDVFAFDIEQEMLDIIKNKTAQMKADNVRAIKRDFVQDGTGLPDASVDYVMLFNILHYEDPVSILNEAHRILRPGGLAGIIHWVYDRATPRGPDLSIRPKPESVQRWVTESGFKLKSAYVNLPPYHYGVLGQKPGD